MASLDPTGIRAQPALTSSDGTVWLIVGGLFALVSLGILVPMTSLPPAPLALVAAIVVAALYVAMIIARVLVAPGRRRLGILATLMLFMAAVALGSVAIVAATAWSAPV